TCALPIFEVLTADRQEPLVATVDANPFQRDRGALPDGPAHAEGVEGFERRGLQDLRTVDPGRRGLPLEHDDPAPAAAEPEREHAAADPTANDDHIRVHGRPPSGSQGRNPPRGDPARRRSMAAHPRPDAEKPTFLRT